MEQINTLIEFLEDLGFVKNSGNKEEITEKIGMSYIKKVTPEKSYGFAFFADGNLVIKSDVQNKTLRLQWK